MFSKALLTLDRSPFSEAAIARVSDVTDTEAVIFGVLESVAEILGRSGPAFDIPRQDAERFKETERQAVEQHLEEAAQQLRAAGIEKVSTVIGEGKPGVEIVKLATQEGCDVVVISTHGRTGLKRAMLGSVADYVVHNLEGPTVLLVRPTGDGAR
jgi:nucleotide-binding universal stress UspA family protein